MGEIRHDAGEKIRPGRLGDAQSAEPKNEASALRVIGSTLL